MMAIPILNKIGQRQERIDAKQSKKDSDRGR